MPLLFKAAVPSVVAPSLNVTGPVGVPADPVDVSTTVAESVIFGTPITLSATVVDTSTGSAGTPTGPVTFRDGATTLGTAALNNSGIATLTVSSLTQGLHVVTAIYG